MPKFSHQSIKAIGVENINLYAQTRDYEHLEYTTEQIEAKLFHIGLSEHQIDLIMARVISGRPFDELAKELGWLDGRSASYFYRKTLAILRKARFLK